MEESNATYYTKDSYREAIRQERMEAYRKALERAAEQQQEDMLVINSFMTWSAPELRHACAKYQISTKAPGATPDAKGRVRRGKKKDLAERLQWAMEGRLPEEFQSRGNKRSAASARWQNTGGMPGFKWRALTPAQRQAILSERRMARATERMLMHQKLANEEKKQEEEEWVEVAQPKMTLEEAAAMLTEEDAAGLQAVFDQLEN